MTRHSPLPKVGDPHELWVFHILPDPANARSAIWAAARVPDDHIVAVMNTFVIRELKLEEEPERYYASARIRESAQRTGRWSDGQPLDFTQVFGGGEYSSKYYAGRRIWRAYNLLVPETPLPAEYGDLRVDAPYPFSLKASKVTPRHIQRVMRDYYQGTPYDLRRSGGRMAGGVWGSPHRYAQSNLPPPDDPARAKLGGAHDPWERPMSIFRTVHSYVAQARSWLPDACGGTLWFAPHVAMGSVYHPIPIGAFGALPPSLTTFSLNKLDRKAAFWAFSATANLAEARFAWVQPEVEAMQDVLERRMPAIQAATDKAFLANGDVAALSREYQALAADVLDKWWAFFDALLYRYADGYLHFNQGPVSPQPLTYPDWWLQAVIPDVAKRLTGKPSISPPTTPMLASALVEETPATLTAATVETAPLATPPLAPVTQLPFMLALILAAFLFGGLAGLAASGGGGLRRQHTRLLVSARRAALQEGGGAARGILLPLSLAGRVN